MTNECIDSENLQELMQCEIKCFQHCLRNERFLCFELPEKCPTCSTYLDSKLIPTKFRVPPFVLPPPLTVTNTKLASLPPFSLLLQPTDGDYLKIIQTNKSNNPSQIIRSHHSKEQHSNNDPDIGDLHIGITNSKAEVFDFDSNGLNRNSTRWHTIPSIVIKLEQQVNVKQQQQHFKDLVNLN